MRSPWVYIKNFIANGCRKIRYGSHYQAGAVTSFAHLRTEIYNGGSIAVGSYSQGRGDTYLIADGGQIAVGEHVYFGPGAYVAAMDAITIGDHCKIGPSCSITDHDHDFLGNMESDYVKAPITIGAHTWIGANVTIVKGAAIGSHCVIAAGSVVRGNVPDGTMYVQRRETEIRPIERREA